MAHFAKLDDNNIVIEVIVVDNSVLKDNVGAESEEVGKIWLEETFGHPRNKWAQTSYNRNFRKHYAAAGYTFDAQRNAFIPPKPYASWTLDEETCAWGPPKPEPGPTSTSYFRWDESILDWKEINR